MKFYSMYLNTIRKRIVNELADGNSKLVISPDYLMEYNVQYYPIDIQNEIAKQHQYIETAEDQLAKAKEEMKEKMNSLL